MITYRLEGNNGQASDCVPATSGSNVNNNAALLTQVDSTQISTLAQPYGVEDGIHLSWTTTDNQPNSADLPNGAYECAFNINSLNGDVNLKVQLIRVNATCTVQETLGTSTSITTTGTKEISFTVDPSAGNATDRYQMRILASNSADHGTQNMVIQMEDNTANYIRGPWTEGTSPAVLINQSSTFFWS